jgi:hypothetical protein
VLFRPQPYRPGPRGPGEGQSDGLQVFRSDRHTLGSIIWMAMLRLVATIFVALYLKDHLAYTEWWMITVGAIYGVALYPAQLQYAFFKKSSRKLMEQTLCSSCRYFNPENLHCMQLDEHVSEHYLPCEGEGWEPKSFEDI